MFDAFTILIFLSFPLDLIVEGRMEFIDRSINKSYSLHTDLVNFNSKERVIEFKTSIDILKHSI
jgi:hypothetical protein